MGKIVDFITRDSGVIVCIYVEEWWKVKTTFFRLLYSLRVALLASIWEKPGKWKRVARAPSRRYEAANAVVNGKLYVFGGWNGQEIQAMTRVDVYNPTSDRWSRHVSALPLPATHANAEADGSTIWFVGGFVGDSAHKKTTNLAFKYETKTNSWHPAPPLPTATASGALVRLGRSLHYFGGFLDRDTTTGNHYVLSLDGGTQWETRAPLPKVRGHHAGVAVGGKLYAVGGQFLHDSPNVKDLNFVHVYDPKTDSWQELTSLPVPCSHHEMSTIAIKGKIVVIGGLNRNNKLLGKRGLSHIFSYDPKTDKWTELSPLPVGLFGASAKVIGNHIIITGGADLLTPDTSQVTTLLGRRTLIEEVLENQRSRTKSS